jgi:aspartyl-tRNA(Asn)/glutamyl-tRNA(Gln) amidotransferase subunit B
MINAGADPKTAANWLINEHMAQLNRREGPTGPSIKYQRTDWSIPVMGLTGPVANTTILQMVASKEISGRAAKEVLEFACGEGPIDDASKIREIVEKHGLRQENDLSALEKIVDDIVAKNADKVADAKTNPKAIGWFVGQVMKASGGNANPQAVNDLLKKRIGL